MKAVRIRDLCENPRDVVECGYYRWLLKKAAEDIRNVGLGKEIVWVYTEDDKIVFVLETGEEVLYSDLGWDVIRKSGKEMIIPPKMSLLEALKAFRSGEYNNEAAPAEWIDVMFE